MRILVASTAFPDVPRLLRQLLPDDEIAVDAGRTDGTADVLIPLMTRIDSALMDRVQPRLIQQFGVGLEGVDRGAARERGIAVANVPADGTGNSDGVGEVAVLHLLALSRRHRAAAQAVAEGRLGEPMGTGLSGTTIVILGLGDVGRAAAQRLAGFGARLIGVGTRTGQGADTLRQQLGLDEYVTVDRFHEVLRGAHALIACCVLNDATRGIVDARALAALGEGGDGPRGFLINVARGPVVDREALLAALRSGAIAGAGLDVYWDEPIDPRDPLLAENVTVTPHVGGVTAQAYDVMARRVVANVEALRRGDAILEA